MRPTKRGPEEAAVRENTRGAGEGLGFTAEPVDPTAEAPLARCGSAAWLPSNSPAIAGSAAAGDWAVPLPAAPVAAVGTATLPLPVAELGIEPCARPVLGTRDAASAFTAPGAPVSLLMVVTSSDAPSSKASSGCSPAHSRTSCTSGVKLLARLAPCVTERSPCAVLRSQLTLLEVLCH